MSLMTDPDVFAAASHHNMQAHLTGPFSAGAMSTPLAVTAAGRIEASIVSREPVLLIAPLQPLDDRVLVVTATLDPDGTATPILPPLSFAAYSEAGTWLPLHVPAVDPEQRSAAPFAVALSLQWRDRDGNVLGIAIPDASAVLQAQLLEGVFGKVLYTLGSEKARLRRQLRELLAMRSLSAARWDALDRFGADLGVPRFSDRLTYHADSGEIVAATLGASAAEPDADFRRRLALYHAWSMPTRGSVLNALNGDGAATDPNRGALGELGLASRLQIEERNNPFAVAIHLVAAPGQATARGNFFQFVADNLLVWPAEFAVDDPHQGRLLSTAQRERLEAQRQALRDGLAWTQAMAITPALAGALERLARVRSVLGIATRLTVKRAFDAAAGSRYELGHGVDIEPPAAAELDAVHASLTTDGALDGLDDTARALLAGLSSRTSADDPLGSWLFEGCGLRTVHQVDTTTLYLSSLPTFGLVIHEAAVQPGGGVLALEALYHAPGDPGTNAVLEAAVADSLAEWAAAAGEALTRLTDAQAQARWRAGMAQPDAARAVLLAAGIAAPVALPPLAAALDRVAPELIAGLELGPVLAAQVLAGNSDATTVLRGLVDILRARHASSVLAFVSGVNQVTLLVGAIGLPLSGVNLSDRRATGFRWYAVPIEGEGGKITPVGSRAHWRPAHSRLTAIVVLGYARRGWVDPYEFRVDLPEGQAMDLTQYEFLMNALERYCPLGVQVNTFNLRRKRVDLDGTARAEPLPPALARTYRKFLRRHRRGEAGVGLQASST